MIIPNKENILTYWSIIKESSPKSEIFKYIFRRLIGIRKDFDKDVYITNNGETLNCGRLINNCTVACSQFEKEMLPMLTNTKVAIDIGENIGKHSIAMAKTGGKVFVVEPDISTLVLLRENVKINNLDDKIIIIPKACSFEPGVATFYRDAIYPTSNSITVKKNDRMSEVLVKVDTVDNICKGLYVDLIKVDCEGGELNVLKGATQTITNSHPKIIFEAWDKKAADEILDYLKQNWNYNKIDQLDEFNYMAQVKY